MEIIFLKLGGSLITDKSTAYTARHSIIEQIVGEIAQAIEKNPEIRLILGNGAGSFAHTSAHMYGTKNGFSTKEGALGACITHADAAYLNSIIIIEGLKKHLPFFSIHPSSCMTAEKKVLQSIFLDPIQLTLSKNLVPCVYGDVILDTSMGSTIFSTDALITHITSSWPNNTDTFRILHAGDYDGVLDREKKPIPLITPDTFDSILPFLYKTNTIDVTGGMENKVRELLLIAEKNISSVIFNGTQKGNIYDALLHKKVPGTYIRRN